MKKLAVFVAVIVLLASVGGCSGFGKWSTGAQTVVDFFCNPSDAQKAEADKWLANLDAVQDSVSAYFPALAIVKASAVMTTIQNGGCYVLAELEKALTLLESMQVKAAAAKGLKAMPKPSRDQFPALWAAVDRVKK